MKTEKLEDANLLKMDIAEIGGLTPKTLNEIHSKYVSFVNVNYTPKTEVTPLDFMLNS
jgi:hypothetical protein